MDIVRLPGHNRAAIAHVLVAFQAVIARPAALRIFDPASPTMTATKRLVASDAAFPQELELAAIS